MISSFEIYEELSKVFDEAKAKTLTRVFSNFIEEVQKTLAPNGLEDKEREPDEDPKDTSQ
jgi:hypothetical protein